MVLMYMVHCLQSFSLMFSPHLFLYGGVYYIFLPYTFGVVFGRHSGKKFTALCALSQVNKLQER